MTDAKHTLPLLIIGCGNMGRAILRGWLRAGVTPSDITILDRHPERLTKEAELGCHIISSLDALAADLSPATILLALKPAQLAEILPDIWARFSVCSPIFLTVAAGKPVSFYSEYLHADANIIRLMPNIACEFGKGVTSAYTDDLSLRKAYKHLLDALGLTVWLDEEDQMHALTAIAGSGPAFVYRWMEAWQQAAKEVGIDPSHIETLVRQTFLGALLLADMTQKPIAELRANVTSKGGTTAEGLAVMDTQELAQQMSATLEAAIARSKELASSE